MVMSIRMAHLFRRSLGVALQPLRPHNEGVDLMTAITKAALNAVGIHNSIGVAQAAGKGAVHIDYRAYERFFTPGWFVRRIGYRTDPGRVHNTVDREKNRLFEPRAQGAPGRAAALAEAKAWAEHRYGITEWWRDPFGGWHPIDTRFAIESLLQVSS